jgi:hypothetical protein
MVIGAAVVSAALHVKLALSSVDVNPPWRRHLPMSLILRRLRVTVRAVWHTPSWIVVDVPEVGLMGSGETL